MSKLWQGLTDAGVNKSADKLNASLSFDFRLWREDIEGSIAHVKMLSFCKIISTEDEKVLVKGLKELMKDMESGKFKADSSSAEDIHSFVELTLTKRLGDVAKKIHTARSRNDQVALDLRLYLKKVIKEIINSLHSLLAVIADKAEKNIDVIMPGFTHLQHAQPVLFSHYLLCYAEMFSRDAERFKNNLKSTDVSPIGSCALAGTGFATDREYEAKLLGMKETCTNSMDGVSDRDFALEFLFNSSVLIMHLSRICEEMIIWNSQEFSYIKIDDSFTTGSSIMPQKKNPDVAELIRGKTGRVYSDLMSLLVTMKALPLAYNKDMQEDKEAVFDCADTVLAVLPCFVLMLEGMSVNAERMRDSAEKGYINATDLADYLTGKGMPFRDAYRLTGQIVKFAEEKKVGLSALSLDEYKKFSPLFEKSLYERISIVNCVGRRKSFGGTSRENVLMQMGKLKKILHNVERQQ